MTRTAALVIHWCVHHGGQILWKDSVLSSITAIIHVCTIVPMILCLIASQAMEGECHEQSKVYVLHLFFLIVLFCDHRIVTCMIFAPMGRIIF